MNLLDCKVDNADDATGNGDDEDDDDDAGNNGEHEHEDDKNDENNNNNDDDDDDNHVDFVTPTPMPCWLSMVKAHFSMNSFFTFAIHSSVIRCVSISRAASCSRIVSVVMIASCSQKDMLG